MDGVTAACVYMACREHRVPRTLLEIAGGGRVGWKEIARTYRVLRHELQKQILPVQPLDYVERFCSALKLSATVAKRARLILTEPLILERLNTRNPAVVVAGAIYLAALAEGEERTQLDVAQTAGVSTVSMRNSSRAMDLDYRLEWI
jgi:transcription initiation factor TFIIB